MTAHTVEEVQVTLKACARQRLQGILDGGSGRKPGDGSRSQDLGTLCGEMLAVQPLANLHLFLNARRHHGQICIVDLFKFDFHCFFCLFRRQGEQVAEGSSRSEPFLHPRLHLLLEVGYNLVECRLFCHLEFVSRLDRWHPFRREGAERGWHKHYCRDPD